LYEKWVVDWNIHSPLNSVFVFDEDNILATVRRLGTGRYRPFEERKNMGALLDFLNDVIEMYFSKRELFDLTKNPEQAGSNLRVLAAVAP
jgi:hypothetical protein